MDTRQFYDDLAEYYDLIFEDWNGSMSRQGTAIAQLIKQELRGPAASPGSLRILDAACGIGTQALPLAARGFRVTGRDLSPAAVTRMGREAAARGVTVDGGVADMRSLLATVSIPFDAVLAFDNSIPHLLTDSDILAAFQQFKQALRPGGVCLCSVRDYNLVQRGVPATHEYSERTRGSERFRLRQEWTWEDPMHYRVTFVVERHDAAGATTVLRTATRYYAISVARLLVLMAQAGFADCRRLDAIIYQPVLVVRCAA